MQRITPLLLALPVTLALTACDNPADSTYTTTATQAQPEPELTEEQIGQTLALTGDNTTVGWTGSKPGGSHDGGFNTLTGELTLNPAGDTIAALQATIDIDSMHSDNDGLTSHLLNPDFFDAETHPESSFVATDIRAATASDATGEVQGATHMITGNFTLTGETRSITFPAVVEISDAAVTLDTTFDINRSQFGMDYGLADAAIRDEVIIRLNLNLQR